MSTVCAEQHQHKFHLSHQPLSPKKTLREIDIPPRKLLTRRATTTDMFSDDTILQKFLPHNDSDSDSDDPYSSDHFRMYEFKVRRCTRSRSHDWTDCPFAHPGEKARRRDPRRYHYSGTVCPEYRRGGCTRGDSCEFAHGVFECWLHPSRYRTEACKDGKNCKRKVCFFAHTTRQLRTTLTVNSPPCSNNEVQFSCNKKKLFSNRSNSNNCCLFCHCGGANSNNNNNNNSIASPIFNCGGVSSNNSITSPTSTLFGMSHFSPPASPPLSPLKPRNNGVSFSSLSRAHRYKVDMLAEILGSFEGLSFNEGSPISSAGKAHNFSWLDDQQQFIVSPSAASNSSSFGCDQDHHHHYQHQQQQQQPQFNNIVSPTTCTQNQTTSFNNNNKSFFSKDNKVVGADVNGSNCPAPDLGWVNELLM